MTNVKAELQRTGEGGNRTRAQNKSIMPHMKTPVVFLLDLLDNNNNIEYIFILLSRGEERKERERKQKYRGDQERCERHRVMESTPG